MMTSALFACALAAWTAVLIDWWLAGAHAAVGDLVRLRLHFNRSSSRDDIEAFVAALTGLRPPWWRRLWHPAVAVFEVCSDGETIQHSVLVDRALLPRVEAALRTHLPSVRTERSDEQTLNCAAAVEYRLTDHRRTLRVDDQASRRLLAGLVGIDHLPSTVQWIVSPGVPPVVPRQSSDGAARGALTSATDVAAAKEKLASPVFGAVLRIGVVAQRASDTTTRLRELESPLHPTAAPGTYLRRRWIPKRSAARRLNQRTVPLRWPIAVNAGELAGLLGWPSGGSTIAGLAMSTSRHLPLSDAVPTDGSIIGDGYTHTGPRTAALEVDGRVRHLALLGATGSGKTTLMINLAIADIEAGHGVVVVDPKGSDLVDGVLERLDPEHHQRVAVLDLADYRHPVGFNPLQQSGVHPEVAVEHLVSILHRVWSQSWGVRSDDLLRMVLRTIAVDPQATVIEVVPLLTNPVFRRPYVEQVTDPALIQFWQQFGALSDSEASQWQAPLLNKLRALVARPSLRRILGQPQPALDIASHLNGGGALLVPLNPGAVGEDAAALFGGLLLGALWNVIQLRRNLPERIPLMLHLDEAGRYAHAPVPLEEMLSQARSFGVGVTLAFQHLGQMSPELRHTVLANPRSRVVFQLGAADSRTMAGEFRLGLGAEDFAGLAPYEVYAQLFGAGRTQPAATLTTRPARPVVGSAELVRDQSRTCFGVDGDSVDAAIAERQRPTVPSTKRTADVPTGRKRRSS